MTQEDIKNDVVDQAPQKVEKETITQEPKPEEKIETKQENQETVTMSKEDLDKLIQEVVEAKTMKKALEQEPVITVTKDEVEEDLEPYKPTIIR